MGNSLESYQDPELKELLNTEQVLESEVREEDFVYSGLKDVDALLKLIGLKFRVALKLLDTYEPAQATAEQQNKRDMVKEKSAEAVRLLEELLGENLSEDQKHVITEAAGYAEVKELFQQFIVRGGGAFFEAKVEDARKTRLVAKAVAESIRKYSPIGDTYDQVFKTEDLPGVLRRLVNFLLPILAPEHQKEPPYGIDEGGELLYTCERMRLPLSQAIHYLENELLPKLERRLESDPGNGRLQREIVAVRGKITGYKRLKFVPRSTPIVMEKGFYTEWLSEYTADGELLVTISVPVKFWSGTNLDRLRELVQTEVVRRLAGKRVCPTLDRDYRYRKSLSSGRRGSTRIPSFKLDLTRGFQELKALYPALKRIEDKTEFRKLVSLVRTRGKRAVQQALEGLIGEEEHRLRMLP